MGLLDLFKRSNQPTRLTPTQVDSNWQKIMDLFPTPTNSDVGKTVVLNPTKTGFNYATLPTGGGNTFSFPAGPTLDISLHRHRLVMNDGGVAKLANLSPGVDGVKGKYRITTDSLPQFPVGAIYEFDFMGVNFNDGDEIVIPVIEDAGTINQYIFVAKDSPMLNTYDFQRDGQFNVSLSNLLAILQNTNIGAWDVSIDGTKIVFRNNHILTGINSSTAYGLPTEYNGLEYLFFRRDIQQFNNHVAYTVDVGFTVASFGDAGYSPAINVTLNPINVDNYYPVPFEVGGYFIDTNGNLAYYNGSTYENVSSITRNIQGELILVSPSNTSNTGVFTAWTPTYQTNQGTNYNITQTRQGINGELIYSYVDYILRNNNLGRIINVRDGSHNIYNVVHASLLLKDWSSIGIPVGDYSDWSIPTTNVELSKIIEQNFIQNQNFFNTVATGHANNEAWLEIEEANTQNNDYGNQLVSFDDRTSTSAFSTWFNYTELVAPMVGKPPMLTKPILGFLQDVVNGQALISDSNINIGVVEDIIHNEITQAEFDDIETNLENLLKCLYVLGTEGQLKKMSLMGNLGNDMVASFVVLGGGLFIGCHAANRGEDLLIRRIVFSGNGRL